jgi:hypothetical protein
VLSLSCFPLPLLPVFSFVPFSVLISFLSVLVSIAVFLVSWIPISVPSSSSSSVSSFEVKLFRNGLGEVGTQLVRRGGVEGIPITPPGEVNAGINVIHLTDTRHDLV